MLPADTAYADDVDFISTNRQYLHDQLPPIADTLKEWDLFVNTSKTEFTTLERLQDRVAEEWRMSKKLGSLIGDGEDVSRRMQLASVSLTGLWTIWVRRLYNSFVLPVLTYNCGTWALTAQQLNRLEAFHRTQLRSILGIRYPNTITNQKLYDRTESVPLGLTIMKARWRLFGHSLRLPSESPAALAMAAFFTDADKSSWRGRPRLTLPVILHQDLQSVRMSLRKRQDLEILRSIALDRRSWIDLCNTVIHANYPI